jgi:hypothetical protein
MGGGVTFLCVYDCMPLAPPETSSTREAHTVRELRWISEEEYGSVVGNDIPVAFSSPELDREASRVTSAVV